MAIDWANEGFMCVDSIRNGPRMKRTSSFGNLN
jgi:hypothetical protein